MSSKTDFLRQAPPLTARLDDISLLIGYGLRASDEFRTAFWNKRRADPDLEVFWLDPDRSEMITSDLAGRDPEIHEFSAFLTAATRWLPFPNASQANVLALKATLRASCAWP